MLSKGEKPSVRLDWEAIAGRSRGRSNADELALARRFVEAGVRFVEIRQDGWDTHKDNFGRLKNRLVPPTGIPMDRIAFSGLRGKGLLHTLTGGVRLLVAFWDCLVGSIVLAPALLFAGLALAPAPATPTRACWSASPRPASPTTCRKTSSAA